MTRERLAQSLEPGRVGVVGRTQDAAAQFPGDEPSPLLDREQRGIRCPHAEVVGDRARFGPERVVDGAPVRSRTSAGVRGRARRRTAPPWSAGGDGGRSGRCSDVRARADLRRQVAFSGQALVGDRDRRARDGQLRGEIPGGRQPLAAAQAAVADRVAQLPVDAVGAIATALDLHVHVHRRNLHDWSDQNRMNWILQRANDTSRVGDMTERIDISSLVPEGYRKVINLDGYVGQHVEQPLGDIVRLRASQLNGCTFCVDMHSVDLQTAGMPLRKIFSVTTWRESEWFTERERSPSSSPRRSRSSRAASPTSCSPAPAPSSATRGSPNLILAIGTINIWNRIAIPTLMAPPAL